MVLRRRRPAMLTQVNPVTGAAIGSPISITDAFTGDGVSLSAMDALTGTGNSTYAHWASPRSTTPRPTELVGSMYRQHEARRRACTALAVQCTGRGSRRGQDRRHRFAPPAWTAWSRSTATTASSTVIGDARDDLQRHVHEQHRRSWRSTMHQRRPLRDHQRPERKRRRQHHPRRGDPPGPFRHPIVPTATVTTTPTAAARSPSRRRRPRRCRASY